MSSPDPSAPLTPELAEYSRQFESIQADTRNLVAGLTDNQFNWRPTPRRWSIGECLEHLNAGHRALRSFDRAIADGKARELFGHGPFRHGLLGNLYIRAMEPPPRIKVPTRKLFVPMPDQPLSSVVPRFLELQRELVRRLQEANGLDLARIKMRSPLSRRFRLSLGQYFAFLAAHERRHLWQARRVRTHPLFPQS